MDTIMASSQSPHSIDSNSEQRRRPSKEEAQAAVRTLIEWAGDNPDREGLIGTPERVARAYREFFAGYDQDPLRRLRKRQPTMR